MKNTRLQFIDFAKGFSILAIVMFHYLIPFSSGVISKVIPIGGSGVHLFFLISGFGLGLSNQKLTAVEFYKKRFVKILIPYYFAIFITFIINANQHFYTYESNTYALLGHILLFKMFDSSIIESYGMHFWFLSTIIQFYLVFPLIIYTRARVSSNQFIYGSLIISVFYWTLTALLNISSQRVFGSFFLQYLWEFNLGYLLVEKYIKNGFIFWDSPSVNYLVITIASYLIMGLMVFFGGSFGKAFNDIPSLLGITSLACFTYGILQRAKHLISFFCFIGKISYEVYLIHLLVFMLIMKYFAIWMHSSPVLLISISVTITILLAMPFSAFNKLILSFVLGNPNKS